MSSFVLSYCVQQHAHNYGHCQSQAVAEQVENNLEKTLQKEEIDKFNSVIRILVKREKGFGCSFTCTLWDNSYFLLGSGTVLFVSSLDETP